MNALQIEISKRLKGFSGKDLIKVLQGLDNRIYESKKSEDLDDVVYSVHVRRYVLEMLEDKDPIMADAYFNFLDRDVA